jgi:hypothetical protein
LLRILQQRGPIGVSYLNDELVELPTANQHSVEVDDECENIWATYPAVAEESDISKKNLSKPAQD